MGLFLLVLFVGGSLAFALRAWATYDEDPLRTAGADSEEAASEKETPLVATLAVVTLLSSFLSELLRHSFNLSFIHAGVISLGVAVVGQWLALRFFGKRRAET